MLWLACLASALLHGVIIRLWSAQPTGARAKTSVLLQVALQRAEADTPRPADPAPQPPVEPAQRSEMRPTGIGIGVCPVLRVRAEAVAHAPAAAMTAPRIRLRPPLRGPVTLAQVTPPAARVSEQPVRKRALSTRASVVSLK